MDTVINVYVTDERGNAISGATITWSGKFGGKDKTYGPVSTQGIQNRPAQIQLATPPDLPIVDITAAYQGLSSSERVRLPKDEIVNLTIILPIMKHAVILVHGIRDYALWQETVGTELRQHGFQVYPTNYGRFDLFRFLVPIPYFRRQAIEEVLNQIRIAKQQNSNIDISIIAHSFGTYVVSYILMKTFDLRFKRVIFCGSVVRYGFPFEQVQQRFEAPILNEVGTRDIWPAMAESITWGYGSAGTYGFQRPLVRDRWHNKAGHGYFLSDSFCKKYWIPFLKNGEIISDNPVPESTRFWLQLISIFRIKYIVLLLIAFLVYHFLPTVLVIPGSSPGAVEGSGPIFQPPRIAGRTIDGCIKSPQFPEATGTQCIFPAQKQIAEVFCRAAGYKDASDDIVINDTGKFQSSFKLYQEIGSDNRFTSRWVVDNTGGFIFNRIVCKN